MSTGLSMLFCLIPNISAWYATKSDCILALSSVVFPKGLDAKMKEIKEVRMEEFKMGSRSTKIRSREYV